MAAALKHMRFIVSMKRPEQQMLQVGVQLVVASFFCGCPAACTDWCTSAHALLCQHGIGNCSR
jgi:hypothetical protein